MAGAIRIAVLPVLAGVALGQQPAAVDAHLRDLSAPDPLSSQRALGDLLAQSGVEIHGRGATRVKMLNLLNRNPERAEQIKTSLIATLEREGAERERLEREGQPEQA